MPISKKTKEKRQLFTEQKGICPICGRRLPPPRDLVLNPDMASTIDHVIPKSRGGENHIDNYQLVHKGCNQEREHEERRRMNTWRGR